MKRWILFFIFYFASWEGGSFLLYFGKQLTGFRLFSTTFDLFLPVVSLLFGYLYFRGSRNSWTDRTVTAIGWTVLLIIFSTLLTKPIYGSSWQDVLTLDFILSHWLTATAILVGGLLIQRKSF